MGGKNALGGVGLAAQICDVFEKSLFGSHYTARSGIEALMEDLGHALATAGGDMRMLGGGNPALIPGVEALWRERMRELMAEGRAFDQMLGVYDPPKGNSRFLLALAGYLQRQYGWNVGAENIAITSGGQTAFFYLFNLLAGEFPGGRRKKILLPIVPEYIGYANQGLGPDFFRGYSPDIDFTGPHSFKYRVDFNRLEIGDDIGAICVSRPTNPSGNVLSDDEVLHLDGLAKKAGVPLIIDNAYGLPFPGILFREIKPIWNENIVLTFSLSKLGLPGTRTGVVVAHPEITRSIAAMTAITGLANGTVGQAMVTPLLETGEMDSLVADSIRPFYRRKSEHARECIGRYFGERFDYFVHENEGALFLWIWFRGLPVTSAELYERLKARGVLIVPGHYFAFGSPESEAHARECIRLSFAMADDTVEQGIEIIADEVAGIWAAR